MKKLPVLKKEMTIMEKINAYLECMTKLELEKVYREVKRIMLYK